MTAIRFLTATAFVALLAGPVAAQVSPNTPSSGQTADVEGQTPATDDATTTQTPATTPPTAPGDRIDPDDSSVSAMPSQTSATGAMNPGGSAETSAGAGMTTSMNGGVRVVSNAPIPDTAENRQRYGQPESASGRARLGEGPVQTLPGRARRR